MAQKVSIELIDDLDGSAADETVAFALDGRFYEVDLSEKNAKKLRDTLEKFTAVARNVRPNGKVAVTRKGGTSETKAIREWAKSKGMDVPDRGRIPAHVLEAYHGR